MVIATRMDGSTRELAHRRGVETALHPEWGGGRSSTASEVATGKVRQTGLRYQTITPVTPVRRPKTAPRHSGRSGRTGLPNSQRPRNTAQTRINLRPKTTLCCSTGCGKGARPLPSYRNAEQARADTGARPRTRHQPRQSIRRATDHYQRLGTDRSLHPRPELQASPAQLRHRHRRRGHAAAGQHPGPRDFSTSSPTTSDPTT